MLAVSSCLYRLYANVTWTLVTKWCVDNKKILLMLSLGCAALTDFSPAYDTVFRSMPWSHLERLQMPAALLQVVRDVYAGYSYELADGEKRTGAIKPGRGVKQGCPPSPLLLSLYMSDVTSRFPNDRGPGLNRGTPRCGCHI